MVVIYFLSGSFILLRGLEGRAGRNRLLGERGPGQGMGTCHVAMSGIVSRCTLIAKLMQGGIAGAFEACRIAVLPCQFDSHLEGSWVL